MVESGILVVDKPTGLTSHQVVGRARRLLGTKKVGHAGTLDPMATGVLILGVNRATRLLGHLALHDKAYNATIRLGQSTNTDDAEGEVSSTADPTAITNDQIEAQLKNFRGDIWQRPSSVSAIKIGGKRAYKLVREGKEVELPVRRVNIAKFEITQLQHSDGFLDVDVVVECSSGTYIRALARDLGEALGVGGHLTKLRRTRIGSYTLEMAQQLGDNIPELMTMAAAAKLSFPCVTASAGQAKDISYGRSIDLEVPAEITGIIGPSGDLLALYKPEGGHARPVAVLA
ncbi:MAG: tRNA pseudouridine(55) synthase TruB [Propionibacterium sp.]|nr:MAG: tRNA pseudouridine(55) synthase TruB [Propionibacterium sp.]